MVLPECLACLLELVHVPYFDGKNKYHDCLKSYQHCENAGISSMVFLALKDLLDCHCIPQNFDWRRIENIGSF